MRLFFILFTGIFASCTSIAGERISFLLNQQSQVEELTFIKKKHDKTATDMINLSILDVENRDSHFVYIDYNLRCEDEINLSGSLSLFPSNQIGNFIIPLRSTDSTTDQAGIESCTLTLNLMGRDEKPAHPSITISGTITYN